MDNISQQDFGWIAGFLEGEGAFGKTAGKTKDGKKSGSIYIQASQVQLHPLEKLQKLLGGSIHKYSHNNGNPKEKDFYRWQVCGQTAEEIMKDLFSLMSPKRQNRILEILSWYDLLPGKNFRKNGRTHCRSGRHPWIPDNIKVDHIGKKFCHPCKMEWQKRNRLSQELILN
jgi:hypothetical protein